MWRLLGCFLASPWREEQNIQVVWTLGRAGEGGFSRGEDTKGGEGHTELARHGQHVYTSWRWCTPSFPSPEGWDGISCLRVDLPRSLWLMQEACMDTSLSPPSLVHLFSNTETLLGFGLAGHGMRVRLTQLPPAWQLWSQFGSWPPRAHSHSRGSRAASQRAHCAGTLHPGWGTAEGHHWPAGPLAAASFLTQLCSPHKDLLLERV